jgi:hypothetical protein
MEDPYTLVREGKWTMDKLYSITKDVYRDLNGSNTADADDLYGFYTDAFATEDAFMVSHGITTLSKDENDIPVIDFFSDCLVGSIESVNRLYWENPGAFVDKELPYEYRARFAAGQAVFSPMLLTYLIESELREMEDDYGVLPYPKLDEAQESYHSYLGFTIPVLFLPANAADPERTGLIMEACSTASYDVVTPQMYEIVTKLKNVRDEDSSEMIEIIIRNKFIDTAHFYDIEGYGTLPTNVITSGSSNSASIIKAFEKIAKKEWEKILSAFEKLS